MNEKQIAFILLLFSGLACLSFLIWPIILLITFALFKSIDNGGVLTSTFVTLFMLSYPMTVSIGFIISLEAYRQVIPKNAFLGLIVSYGHLVIVFTFLYFRLDG